MTKKIATAKNEKIIGDAENWESGILGNDEAFAKAVKGATKEAIDEKLALQMISIRFKKTMIDDLKFIAEVNGIKGYQPLIRRVLERFISSEMKVIAIEYEKQQREREEEAKQLESQRACG